MHELGLVMSLLDFLEEMKADEKLKSIISVTLEVGELSGVLPDYFKECWSVARLDTPFADTQLELKLIPALAECVCGEKYEMMKNSRVCPACHKTEYKIIDGKQFTITQITVDD